MSNLKKRLDHLQEVLEPSYREAVMLFVAYNESEEDVLARSALSGDEFVIFVRWIKSDT